MNYGYRRRKKEFLRIFEQHFSTVDEQALIILKGHLLIEEKLNDIISNFVFHPEILENARLGFYQRVYLAKSFSLHQSNNSMWDLIIAINSLRNKFAHKLEIKAREKSLEHIHFLYVREMAGDEFEKVWDTYGSAEGLAYSLSLIPGLLLTFEKESRRFKEMIADLDKMINIHKHKG